MVELPEAVVASRYSLHLDVRLGTDVVEGGDLTSAHAGARAEIAEPCARRARCVSSFSCYSCQIHASSTRFNRRDARSSRSRARAVRTSGARRTSPSRARFRASCSRSLGRFGPEVDVVGTVRVLPEALGLAADGREGLARLEHASGSGCRTSSGPRSPWRADRPGCAPCRSWNRRTAACSNPRRRCRSPNPTPAMVTAMAGVTAVYG
jgi:hypothetical protein